MKVKVIDKGKKIISLRLPLSAITWKWVIKKLVAKQQFVSDLGLTVEEIKLIFRGTLKSLRDYRGLTLVDVASHDGSNVLVTL